MMDKKLIEKYLKLYPEIDKYINLFSDDLKYYQFKKTEYEMSHQNCDDIIEKIESGLKRRHEDILGLLEIKDYVAMTLVRASRDCKKIVDMKLWQGKQWSEIASKVGISTRQAKRIYDQFFNYFENFKVNIDIDDI